MSVQMETENFGDLRKCLKVETEISVEKDFYLVRWSHLCFYFLLTTFVLLSVLFTSVHITVHRISHHNECICYSLQKKFFRVDTDQLEEFLELIDYQQQVITVYISVTQILMMLH